MNFWENAEKIAREKGLKRGWKTPVMQQAGMNITLIAKQKKTNAPPNAKIIIAVAQYLGVTTDYLLTGNEGAKPAHPSLASTLDAMRDMTNKARPHFADAARAVADTADEEQEPSAVRLADMAQTAQRAAPKKQIATRQPRALLPIIDVFPPPPPEAKSPKAAPPSATARDVIDLDDMRKGKKYAPIFQAAAGKPIDLNDATELFILPEDIDPDTHIAVRVNGTSMVDAGIPDRAMCLFKRQESAENGDIALIDIDGTTTIKKVKIARGAVALHWCDGSGRVDTITAEDYKNTRIIGTFVRVVRGG